MKLSKNWTNRSRSLSVMLISHDSHLETLPAHRHHLVVPIRIEAAHDSLRRADPAWIICRKVTYQLHVHTLPAYRYACSSSGFLSPFAREDKTKRKIMF
ncbi:hypothetical protein EVAR_37709_1 [Eumeta japonica]|uniref:Uncharacterized protein n=1 Tax=Eumeta variegata TaxID=151549 RepID=A0A4C1XQC6_EUMVA|nr:hypothetical protein EVAR_37709_1 [Eumeta japonica]